MYKLNSKYIKLIDFKTAKELIDLSESHYFIGIIVKKEQFQFFPSVSGDLSKGFNEGVWQYHIGTEFFGSAYTSEGN